MAGKPTTFTFHARDDDPAPVETTIVEFALREGVPVTVRDVVDYCAGWGVQLPYETVRSALKRNPRVTATRQYGPGAATLFTLAPVAHRPVETDVFPVEARSNPDACPTF